MSRRYLVALALVFTAGCHRSPAKPATNAAPVAQAKLTVHHQAGGIADGQAPGSSIEVIVDGKPVPDWTPERIAAAASIPFTNQNGEQRDAWLLKTLTHSLLGPKARIVALDSEDRRVAIDERAWNDPARLLVMRLSHRGQYKANWMQGDVADEALIKGITRIEIAQR
jgi:hypothetical protein